MSQVVYPSSVTTDEWVGEYTALADANDATYLQSPTLPVQAQTFLCPLGAATDPNVDTGHQIKVRAYLYPSGGTSQDLVLVLENSDDGSEVATRTYTPLPNPDAIEDEIFALTEAESALIHDHGALRIRGHGKATTGTAVAFVWDDVTDATSYVLQVGTSSGASNRCNSNVGNVLTYELTLAPGTYYSRVVAYQNTTPLSTTAQQTVVVA